MAWRDDDLDAAARAQLLQEIEDYFSGRVKLQPKPAPNNREVRVATAVLLLELGRADMESRHDEHRAVARTLERVLQATPEQTAAIVRLAEEQVRASRPLHHFTTLIDRGFARAQKRELVEGLWRVAFADAEILAHEEYLIRKIADLIHLPFEDFLLAKIDAREAFLRDG